MEIQIVISVIGLILFIIVSAYLAYLFGLSKAKKTKGASKKYVGYVESKLKTELEPLYTFQDGTVIYTTSSPINTVGVRAVESMLKTAFANLGIKDAEIIEVIAEMQILIDSKELDDTAKVSKIREYINWFALVVNGAGNEETLIDLACIYTFLEDEDLAYTENELQRRKRKLILESKESKVFFLSFALQHTDKLQNLQTSDLEQYYRQIQKQTKRQNRVLRYIRSTK